MGVWLSTLKQKRTVEINFLQFLYEGSSSYVFWDAN